MSTFSAGDKYATLDQNIPMTADYTGATLDVGAMEYVFLGIHWSGSTSTTCTAYIESSATGLPNTWEQYPGSVYTMTTASGNHYWDIATRAQGYMHIVYSHDANAGGTYSTDYREEVPV